MMWKNFVVNDYDVDVMFCEVEVFDGFLIDVDVMFVGGSWNFEVVLDYVVEIGVD